MKKLEQGNLTGITITVNDTCNILTLDSSAIDLTSLDNPKMKLFWTYNYYVDHELKRSVVLEDDSAGDTWTYANFQDGWYTPYLFAVESYIEEFPPERKIGMIIYYDGINSGFYKDTVGSGEGTPDNSEDWVDVTFSDWLDFMGVIDSRGDGLFKGEYGTFHKLVLCLLTNCKKDKAIEMLKKDDDCICNDKAVNEYSVIDLKLFAAEALFCQEAFAESQKVIESLIDICGCGTINSCCS